MSALKKRIANEGSEPEELSSADGNSRDSRVGRSKNLNIPLDIGPALLLLSHGPFLGIIVASSTIPYLLFIAASITNKTPAKALAIAWCIFGILMAIWTVYAIIQTWRENGKVARFKKPTYGVFGFLYLTLLVVLLGAINIWTMVLIIQDV